MGAWGDAAAMPPELNHTLLSTGDLGASLTTAAAGYESVADMLMAEITAMGINTSTTAMIGWQGAGGVAMQMSAADFMAVCAAASAWVRVGQAQAMEVTAAHTVAVQSMIPAEVCLTNRSTQAGLVASNILGQNTPAIVGLDAQYFGEFWVQNATARTGYGSVVTTAMAALSVPGPFSPTASNPATAAASIAQTAATEGGNTAMQASQKSAEQIANGPLRDAASAPSSAQGMMSSMGGQMSSMLGQLGGQFGQVTQMGQQLPQMLGQAPQMLSGMLGQFGQMGGPAAAVPAGLTPGLGAPPVGALGGLPGGGIPGGGIPGGPSSVPTSFVRPAGSFNSPANPTLPGGWQGAAGSAAETRAAGMGGGGMYGAPPPMGRENGQSETAKSPKTMQVAARPGGSRGEQRT
ncbi:PPE domain-containing protein [Mycolicibacterium llatzerense]|uniref:PPE domain-containing protein n=1 Tax=Mycolicibacterium llatzerense TaxID=280871 RepID=UPI000A707DB9|nr:PPE domain-containing protein [Mycolicibacterium llatzerense]